MTKRDEASSDSPPEERKAERRGATRLPLHLQSLQMCVRHICSLLLTSPTFVVSLSEEDAARLQSYAKDGF